MPLKIAHSTKTRTSYKYAKANALKADKKKSRARERLIKFAHDTHSFGAGPIPLKDAIFDNHILYLRSTMQDMRLAEFTARL